MFYTQDGVVSQNAFTLIKDWGIPSLGLITPALMPLQNVMNRTLLRYSFVNAPLGPLQLVLGRTLEGHWIISDVIVSLQLVMDRVLKGHTFASAPILPCHLVIGQDIRRTPVHRCLNTTLPACSRQCLVAGNGQDSRITLEYQCFNSVPSNL